MADKLHLRRGKNVKIYRNGREIEVTVSRMYDTYAWCDVEGKKQMVSYQEMLEVGHGK